MSHPVYRILGFDIVGPYSLHVKFDDGIERSIDFEGILEGELLSPLKDPRLFAQVDLDPETHTLVWPNGADFDPETLHNWPEYADELAERAQKWAKVYEPSKST